MPKAKQYAQREGRDMAEGTALILLLWGPHTHTSGVTYSMAGDGEFRGCGYRGVASMECRSTLKLHNFKKQIRV